MDGSDWAAGEHGSKRAQKAVDHAASNSQGQSPIHIDPANEGKFTAYAKGKGQSVQQAASSVLKDPEASPTLKKRANFARNASQWHH